jgi:hypothetical protein
VADFSFCCDACEASSWFGIDAEFTQVNSALVKSIISGPSLIHDLSSGL